MLREYKTTNMDYSVPRVMQAQFRAAVCSSTGYPRALAQTAHKLAPKLGTSQAYIATADCCNLESLCSTAL